MRPAVGVFALSGCAGDQLVMLECLERLRDVVDVRDFALASSARDTECALDLAFVEGAVITADDERRVRSVRERARTLVAIGTCAVWGGVPGMPAPASRSALLRDVYGEASLAWADEVGPVRAVRDVVTVDAGMTGCPVEAAELLGAIADLVQGNLPVGPQYPVCTECRIREQRCVLVADGALCFGPLTLAGCGARCLAAGVACIGCRGPAPDANVASALRLFESKGYSRTDLERRLSVFARFAPDEEGRS